MISIRWQGLRPVGSKPVSAAGGAPPSLVVGDLLCGRASAVIPISWRMGTAGNLVDRTEPRDFLQNSQCSEQEALEHCISVEKLL